MAGNPNPKRENLKPFEKGVSGNPGGYSKGRRVTAAIFRRIEEEGLDEEFADIWIAQIRKGNYQFFRELLDRTEGKLASVVTSEAEDEIDWSELDNEGDTPPRSTDTKGV